MPEDKLDHLRSLLEDWQSCLIAYSGGVDSVFLAHVAYEVLGNRTLAVIADSPSLPRRELEEAKAIALDHGFPLEIIRTAEFENPDYVANPANRCYFCKHELFHNLSPLAKEKGFRVIAYGENASDLSDFRPGAQAAMEFDVVAPLKEVGLTKNEIRELSRQRGLPTAEKPQMPCLSSRIPHGEQVTPEKLGMVEQAELFLRDAGFREVRVRHHESDCGALARIELGSDEIPSFLESGWMTKASGHFKSLGYSNVTLDHQGYRRGSLNPALLQSPAKAGND